MHAVLNTLIEDVQRYQALAQRTDEVQPRHALPLARMKVLGTFLREVVPEGPSSRVTRGTRPVIALAATEIDG